MKDPATGSTRREFLGTSVAVAAGGRGVGGEREAAATRLRPGAQPHDGLRQDAGEVALSLVERERTRLLSQKTAVEMLKRDDLLF